MILAFNSRLLSQYRRATRSAVIKELQGRGIIEQTEPGDWHTRKAAEYICNLELIADTYNNLEAGRLCFTLQEARDLNPKRRRQTFDKTIPAGIKQLLKNSSLTWNAKAAFKALLDLSNDAIIKTWPQIRYTGSGAVKPYWHKASSGRLYARRPGIQAFRKELRKPGIIAGGADLYEVDFTAQEPNIALALQKKPASFNYQDTPPDIKAEYKAFLTAALHGQDSAGYIFRYQAKHGQGTAREAGELYSKLIKHLSQTALNLPTDQRILKELGQELQRTGATIFESALDIAIKARPDWTGALLPLHDGLIIEGESAAGDFYNYFKQASRDILGQELPLKPPAKLNP